MSEKEQQSIVRWKNPSPHTKETHYDRIIPFPGETSSKESTLTVWTVQPNETAPVKITQVSSGFGKGPRAYSHLFSQAA
ncbi:hypothetical protein GCM10011571_13570 [Marinithermofilum abyssi]|uniref:Uncharacterized protein n=1 Tax=Marinithermofilum abyssi TaxID=1571185 RepID=A0A8J2VES2_9BACL|nr:hypothetical protein [Marinithermofilum abyssi]GGE13408.1 hypothetical protein GCM10011571_13570 [Marinithermofilum abyssi]